ncbi:hypothetical protein GCM10011492_01040 [Flexivirga endophytica]|uniref:Uncharacterized protein n=1 Tax=Flexivirga endophytica TaxID=1849103 RepID=A0A916WNM4_9MICO|nr:hypothetical protein GCM10011492_01040 [Flexivirga endophytica]GHB65092.1 hypothetical protein GCM10008112_37450 [Flexivirga endophytica]
MGDDVDVATDEPDRQARDALALTADVEHLRPVELPLLRHRVSSSRSRHIAFMVNTICRKLQPVRIMPESACEMSELDLPKLRQPIRFGREEAASRTPLAGSRQGGAA